MSSISATAEVFLTYWILLLLATSAVGALYQFLTHLSKREAVTTLVASIFFAALLTVITLIANAQ